MFLAAVSSANFVCQEKDRGTITLLLLTRLNNLELVAGKLMASLLNVLVLLVAAWPFFALATLLGGTTWEQVIRTYLVTIAAATAASALGCLMGFWRELSARYAQRAEGCVHVLLTSARLELTATSERFWGARMRRSTVEGLGPVNFLDKLKTFGFVEFPILSGILSRNAGVTMINIYERLGNEDSGNFAFVENIDPRKSSERRRRLGREMI